MIFKTIETAEATLIVTNYIDETKLKPEELEWLKELENKYRKDYGRQYEENNMLTFNRDERNKLRDIINRLENEEDYGTVDWGIDSEVIEMTNYNVEDYKNVILEEE